MDVQAYLESMSELIKSARKPYHLSLGALTEALHRLPMDMTVITDTHEYVGAEHSYRGYYDDLAFAPGKEAGSCCGLLYDACLRAATNHYEGYKGGNYLYDNETPLWFAQWGETGRAIVGYQVIDTSPKRRLMLLTKEVD